MNHMKGTRTATDVSINREGMEITENENKNDDSKLSEPDPAFQRRAKEIEEQHRRTFNELVSGMKQPETTSTTSTTPKKNSMMTKSEYMDHLKVVRYWNDDDGHNDPETGAHITKKEFRRMYNSSWYEKIKNYRIITRTNEDGTSQEVLQRREEKSKEWKQVVHMDNVYDAIKECHVSEEHKSITSTKDETWKRYCNITLILCRIFVQTCPICNLPGSKGRTPKASKKDPTPNALKIDPTPKSLHERFNVRVLDYRRQSIRDMKNRPLLYVLLVFDIENQWIILRPIKELNSITLETELLTIACIARYPPSWGKDTIRASISDLVIKTLKRYQTVRRLIRYDANEIAMNRYEYYVRDVIETYFVAQEQNMRFQNWISVLQDAAMTINNANDYETPALPIEAITAQEQSKEERLNNQVTNDKDVRTSPYLKMAPPSPSSTAITKVLPPTTNEIYIPTTEQAESLTNQSIKIEHAPGTQQADLIPQSAVEGVHMPVKEDPRIEAGNVELLTQQSDNKFYSEKDMAGPQTLLSQFADVIEDKDAREELKAMVRTPIVNIRHFFQAADATNSLKKVDSGMDEVETVDPDGTGTAPFLPKYSYDDHTRMSVSEAFGRGLTETRNILGMDYSMCHPKLI